MEVNERQDQTIEENADDPDYRAFLNPSSTNNEVRNQPRRSTRVPLLSAKALEHLVDNQ